MCIYIWKHLCYNALTYIRHFGGIYHGSPLALFDGNTADINSTMLLDRLPGVNGYIDIVYPLSFFYIDGEIVNFEVGDYSSKLIYVMDKYNSEATSNE